MEPESFPRITRPLRKTLRWLVSDAALADASRASEEERFVLRDVHRYHESISRLPPAAGRRRCIIVGSEGVEVPYLMGRLGWEEVVCITLSRTLPGAVQRRVRRHPNGAEAFAYSVIEHDIERATWPLPDESFALALYWCCIERLRYDPEFTLFELNRVCAPDAVVSLVTENPVSFQATLELLAGRPRPLRLHWPADDGPCRLYAPQEISSLLSGTGWRVDLLTSIASESDDTGRWWKRWKLRRFLAQRRRGLGLSDSFGRGHLLAGATRASSPTRRYPSWLYHEEKIRRLKIEMMELVTRRAQHAAAG